MENLGMRQIFWTQNEETKILTRRSNLIDTIDKYRCLLGYSLTFIPKGSFSYLVNIYGLTFFNKVTGTSMDQQIAYKNGD